MLAADLYGMATGIFSLSYSHVCNNNIIRISFAKSQFSVPGDCRRWSSPQVTVWSLQSSHLHTDLRERYKGEQTSVTRDHHKRAAPAVYCTDLRLQLVI